MLETYIILLTDGTLINVIKKIKQMQRKLYVCV